MANGNQQSPFRAPTEAPISQLPVPGGDNISDGGLPPATIDATPTADDTITDESVMDEAEKAGGGMTSLLLIGAVGFGLYLAFRR